MDLAELFLSVILAILCAATTSFYLKSQYQEQEIGRLQKQPTDRREPASTPSLIPAEDNVTHLQSKISNFKTQLERLQVSLTIFISFNQKLGFLFRNQ